MTPKELLEAAYEKIKDPNNRCTRAYARDERGFDVPSTDSKACQWCAMGALYSFCPTYNIDLARSYLSKASHELFYEYVTTAFDEDPSRADELYLKAIELVEQEENNGLSH